MAADFIPDDQFQPDAPAAQPQAVAQAPQQGAQAPSFIPDAQFQSDEDKYGTTTQQAITGVEGLAKGIAGPLATGAERMLGVPPEDIRLREETNPITHGVGEATGFVGSALAGTGEAALLAKAGKAAEAASGIGKSGFVAQVGSDAVRGAMEAGLMQGGEELHKAFVEDPDQTAGHAIADIGLSGVLGGVFGGALGAALRKTGIEPAIKEPPQGQFVSELDRGALEAGDFKASIENSDLLKPEQKEGILAGLKKQKPDAPEIIKAAKAIGATPLEGMTSASEAVQKAEDSLVNGAPTFSGLKRQQLYNNNFEKINDTVNTALGEGSEYSKAELGNKFQDTLTSQIKEENAPIRQMYDNLKQNHATIPVGETGSLVKELESMPELRVTAGSPKGSLIKSVLSGLDNVKTVDDLKIVRSSIFDSIEPTTPPEVKRMAAILADKLKTLEDDSVESFAKSAARTPEEAMQASGLRDARKAADAQYKPFMQKLETLAEQLGKRRVHGPQDAINFIQNMTPEAVTQKLFSKNNSEFLKFFSKEFPEQMELMRQYQKGVLREQASKSGSLSPKVLFNNVNKLEPEIQKSIFTAEELSKLKDSETVLNSFPKNFNPSGTSGMSAMREFFQHPSGAAMSNARDYGIEKFIKFAGQSPEIAQAQALAKATVAGDKTADRAIRSIFSGARQNFPTSVIPAIAQRDKLAKQVDDYNHNPDKMLAMNDSNPIPGYASSFASTSARAVQYLTSIKPNMEKLNPLDSNRVISSTQKAAYNKALDIAQQPLSILHKIHTGMITPSDITTLKTIYPQVYNNLSNKITSSIIDSTSKGKTIPYNTRMSLSIFLGQPLDSTMTPGAIQTIQMSQQSQQNTPQTQQNVAQSPKKSTSGLNKIPQSAMTASQARESDRNKRTGE